MAYSTSTSGVEGLMETIQASATAKFAIGSRLHLHIYPVASTNANTVQLPVATVPAAVAATAETASITDAALAITAVTATPSQFGAATKISKKALLGGTNVIGWAMDTLVNKCVASYDKDISSVFTTFTDATVTPTGVASLTLFGRTVADVRNRGFGGSLHAAFSVNQVELVLAGVTFAIPQTEEYIREGYIGRLKGAELVAVPEALLTLDTTYGGAVWFKEFGIAVGYHAGDSITGIMTGTGAPAPLVHMAEVPIDVISTNLSAAVFSKAANISVSGGAYANWALS